MNNDERKDFNVAFGNYIKEARLRKNLAQGVVSKQLGVAQGYYCNIEQGNRNIDLQFAMKICDVLNISLNDFVDSQKR